MRPLVLILMGVAGSGKSTIGGQLAQAIGAHFLEGDNFHPAANIAKMSRGQSLTDADRAPWLSALRQEIQQALKHGQLLVMTCSALKQAYREQLQQGDARVQFIHLAPPCETLTDRLAKRSGHFLPASLLASQLATLEPPVNAWIFGNDQSPAATVAAIRQRLAGL